MSVEALLTVVTVFLAVLALIPQERAQDLRIRLGRSAVFVGWVAGSLVFYWALLEPLHSSPGLRALPRPIPWQGNWTPGTLSLLVLLLATAFGWWSYRRRLPVYRLPRLAAVVTDVLARRRFGECSHLLERHFDSIRRGLHGEYWQARARTKVFPTPAELHLAAMRTRSASTSILKTDGSTSYDAAASMVAHETPTVRLALPTVRTPSLIERWGTAWAEKPRDAAEDIVRTISLAPQLVNEIAAVNPYLALRLFQLRSSWLYREFAEAYARALLSDAESVLYRELRRAENIDADSVPIVDEREQPLLAALSADAARTDGPGLLYTFLDLGIEPLRWSASSSLRHTLNAPMADYRERGRWTSPPFATIYLLAVIAPRVAVNPQAPGINLYVLRTLVGAVLMQMEPDAEVDPRSEWPTPSHYLVYEAVSLLCDIVRILQSRPEQLRLVRDAHAKQPGFMTLPDQAIEILGSVMYECLRSDRLDGHFKGYLLDVWWPAYSDKYRGGWPRSGDVLDALVRGGFPGKSDMAHRKGLISALQNIDPVLDATEAAHDLRKRFNLLD